ncbi:MAG: anthranilate phosphoribosyltransferase [Candidatus Omnitrophica bacterium]|nr:anthranilate phosphoribosyltransferase [Candidatus Omnitrophota bacterium]
MIKDAINLLSSGSDLNASLMSDVMDEIMGNKAKTPDIVDFLKALAKKGETVEELVAAVRVMRRHANAIKVQDPKLLDTCGTGGDSKGTFNISTAVAFVASAAGISVAKHGNRSVSSLSGSADVLEALGVNIELKPQKAKECLEKTGIAFLFAPSFHPAMKYAMPARKEIGKRTIFNLLGPLSNPANAAHQLVGVYDKRWVPVLAEVLLKLGSKHALVVCGSDGLDEISTTATTYVAEAYQGKVNAYKLDPQDFWIKKAKLEELQGADAKKNAEIILDILRGASGACRDIVVLNAAAAIYAADAAASIKEGIELARRSIDSKKAMEKLQLLKNFS